MRSDDAQAAEVRQRGDAERDADLGVGHRVIDRRDQIVDQAFVALDERGRDAVRAGLDVERRRLDGEAGLLFAEARVDRQQREPRAVERHFDLFAGTRVAEQVAERLGEEVHAEHVVAVGRERVVNGDAAAGAGRRAVDAFHLRRRLRQLEGRLRGRTVGIADRQHRDAARGAQIAFHQRRREGLHVGDVVEPVADRVGGQERRHVDVEIEQVPNLARVLGAVQSLERAPPRIRVGRRGRIHARFERGDQLRDLSVGGPPRAARRHHAGAQLVDHLFREFAIGRRAGHVPAGQRQFARLAAIVVTAGAGTA